MKFSLKAIMSVSIEGMTLVGITGEDKQTLDYAKAATAEVDSKIEDGVQLKGNRVTFIKPGLYIITQSRLGKIEILKATQDDIQLFALLAQNDPEVIAMTKKIYTSVQTYTEQFVSQAQKVLDFLPDSGPTAKMVGKLESIKWDEVIIEVSGAIKQALPETWVAIQSSLSPSTVAWLNSKLP